MASTAITTGMACSTTPLTRSATSTVPAVSGALRLAVENSTKGCRNTWMRSRKLPLAMLPLPVLMDWNPSVCTPVLPVHVNSPA